MLFSSTTIRLTSIFHKRLKLKALTCPLVFSIREYRDILLNDVPRISLVDIKRELRMKGFVMKDGHTCIITKCPICGGKTKTASKDAESIVYINKFTGYFVCPMCNHYGEWSVMEMLLKNGVDYPAVAKYLERSKIANDNFAHEWAAIKSRTISLTELTEEDLTIVLECFELPVFVDCGKVLSDVRFEKESTTLYFPLTNNAERVIGYEILNMESKSNAATGEKDCGGHFMCRIHKTTKDRAAILVPTLQDVLTLAANRISGSLIWWRNATLPPMSLASLEPFSRVVIWGAWGGGSLESASGVWSAAARLIADKIGLDRCHFIRPVEGQMSVVEAAHMGKNIKTLISDAQPAAHRSIATFAALRQDVLADLHNSETVKGVKWKRFPTLTRLLGGHRRGELTVLTGPTGCGKTTLMAEYSLDLALQGVTTLWGSFEIKNSRLARTMLQQLAGVPLEENLDQFDSLADKFEQLPIYYLMFHGSQSIKVVMEAVEHAAYVHDIAHVIVDNVQFMMGIGEDASASKILSDRFWKQDAIISAFRTFATRRNCHVTLVMHPRKERDVEDLSTSSIFGSAKASQEADNVLIIQDKRLTTLRGKKFLQVAKNRFSGDLGIVPLEFDKASLSYGVKRRPSKTEAESAGATEPLQPPPG